MNEHPSVKMTSWQNTSVNKARNDQLQYISQHTAHNDQIQLISQQTAQNDLFPSDAVNTIKKRSNNFQLENPITI
jgi:hypothetical protein